MRWPLSKGAAMAQAENEIDWSDVHRAMKEDAEGVRLGAGLPCYNVHETYYDGSVHVENQITRELTLERKRHR